MKKLKKINLEVNSAEEMFRNCVCAQVRCPCNPTYPKVAEAMSEQNNRSTTRGSIRATDGPLGW